MSGEVLKKRILALNGVFAVNKPTGESSARVVEKVKNSLIDLIKGDRHLPHREFSALRKSLKVGHGGTLDPLATGVLVIGLGSGCKRLQQFLTDVKKGYRAVGRFGEAYDTFDCTGKVTKSKPFDHISEQGIRKVLQERFTGTIMQVPPIFSALRINGERAYSLARKRQQQTQSSAAEEGDHKKAKPEDPNVPPDGQLAGSVEAEVGEEIKMTPREVTIDCIKLLRWEKPEFEIEMECGSGTYVRSVFHDLGEMLDSAAAMFALVRTKQGSFCLEDCLSVDDLTDLEKIEKAICK